MKLMFTKVDDAVAQKLDSLFPISNSFIQADPGRVLLPRKYAEISESILNLPIYSDDVWLISYPRTGSTWAQEMIWLLGNNLDYEGAKQMQPLRSPLLELNAIFSEDHREWVSNSIGNTVERVQNMIRPRFAKSHLSFQLLPNQFDEVKPKIIYTARNPKDLCVSFYHYCKLIHGLSGPFDEFCNLFINGNAPFGSYWSHVLPFWNKRNDSNILFLKYEDMKRNLPSVIKQCAKFLNINYELTENDMEKICEHLKFDKMQLNPAVNLEPIINNPNNVTTQQNGKHIETAIGNGIGDIKFIRKGQIGDWKNYISEELSIKFDDWIEKNTNGTGLTFEYE